MLADTLASFEERSPKPTYLIVGMMGQKDALGFLAPFRGLVRMIYTVPIPGAHEAPHSEENLAEIARSAGLNAVARGGIIAALETHCGSAAGRQAGDDLRLALSRRPRPCAAGRHDRAIELRRRVSAAGASVNHQTRTKPRAASAAASNSEPARIPF